MAGVAIDVRKHTVFGPKLTFREDAEVYRVTPAILGCAQPALDEANASHGTRIWVTILETTSARVGSGQSGQQQSAIVFGGQLDGLIAVFLGHLQV